MHCLVLGPGLGRREAVLDGAARVLTLAARQYKLPVIIDADALFFLRSRPELVYGCANVILTPNAAEFEGLCQSLGAEIDSTLPQEVRESRKLMELCRILDGVTVIKKGRVDLISDGVSVLAVDETSSPRRCGGLGDLLSGTAAVFALWASRANTAAGGDDAAIKPQLWAAYAACVASRRAAKSAFATKKRSMTAPDVLAHLGAAFEAMVPTEVVDTDPPQ